MTTIQTDLGDSPVLRIFGGSKDSPVIFTTGDKDDRERGLILSDGAGNSAIGSGIENTSADGYLTIKGGYYKIGANDLVIGGHYGKNGVVTLDYGKIETRYWLVMGGYADGSTSEFNINDGEVQVGSGNGRLVIGQYAKTKATVTQTGGTVTSGQSVAALEIACNNATGTYNISGGSYTGNGNAWLGNGNGSKAYVNVSGSGNMSLTGDFILGNASDSYGELNLNGGTLTVASLKRGNGKGKIVFNGGTLKPQAVNTAFMPASEDFDVQIAEGGLVIDTEYDITIAAKIYGSGPITKKGSGTVTFSGDAIYYTGTVTKDEGAGDVIFASGAWRGTTADQSGNYLVSEPTNWHQGQVPSGIAFFGGAESAGKTVTFGANLNLSGDVDVISWSSGNHNYYADENGWCTWKATDPSYGVKQTVGALLIGQGESGTGRLAISSGTHNFSGKIRVGDWKGTGYLKVDGGYVESADEVYIAGDSAHSTGKVYVNGGALVNRNWFCVGRAEDCDAYLEVNGGAVSNLVNNLTIGTVGNSSSKAEMLVKKGEVYTAGNLYVGEWDSATVTVQGGDVIVKGNVVFGDSTNFGSDETATLNIEGGTIIAKQFNKGEGSGTATLNLKGGTIKAAGDADSYIIYAASGRSLSVALAEGTTSTIDVNGQDQHINVPLSGTGTLRVTGGGSLELRRKHEDAISVILDDGVTLTVQDGSEFNSLIIQKGARFQVATGGDGLHASSVEFATGGEVSLPSWYTTSMKLIISGNTTLVVPQGTALGDVEFRDNGRIVYALSGYTAGESLDLGTIGNIAYPNNEGIADHIAISFGDEELSIVSNNSGTLAVTPREVVWIGSGSVDYTEDAQWQGGAPGSYDIAVFNTAATVTSAHPAMKLASGAKLTMGASTYSFTRLIVEGDNVVIDDNSRYVTLSGNVEGQGKLKKDGLGAVVFAGNLSLGGLTVNESVAVVRPGALIGSVVVNEKGAIVVDMTSVKEQLENDAAIDLFTAAEITFEDTTFDSIDTTIFLSGPVVKSSLVYGNSKLTANILDASLKDNSRKVTTWIGGNKGNSIAEFHIDNDTHFSNGQPGGAGSFTKKYDLLVVPGDAKIWYYYHRKDTWDRYDHDNAPSYGELIIRHGTLDAISSNGWPNNRADRIAGVGVVRLARVGLQNLQNYGSVVDRNITIEFTNEGVGAGDDTWISGDGSAMITVNGNLLAVDGIVRPYGNYTVNGDFKISNGRSPNLVESSGKTVVINGSLTVGEGSSPTIGSGTLNIGENATLILEGGGLGFSEPLFPKATITAGNYVPGSLPPVSGNEYTLLGGRLVMSPAEAKYEAQEAKRIIVKGGTLVVDLTTSELSEGDTITLSAVQCDDVETAANSIFLAGKPFDWSLSLDPDTKVVSATASTAVTDNEWVGPDLATQSDWGNAACWKHGVPSATMSCSFTKNVRFSISDSSWNNYKINELKIANDCTVTFGRDTSGDHWPKLYLSRFDGPGKLIMARAGLTNNDGVKANLSGPIDFVFNDGRDNWVDNNSTGGGSITLSGPIYVGAPVGSSNQQYLDFNGGITVTGSIISEGVINIKENVIVTGDIACNSGTINVNKGVELPGNLSGGGKIVVVGTETSFSGDNSGFTGNVVCDGNKLKFTAAKAGFANASSITVTGSIEFWFDSGEISLGGDLTMTAKSLNQGINIPKTCTGITMVVGNNNGRVELLSDGYTYEVFHEKSGGGWPAVGTGSEYFTLKKVGTGAMTTTMTAPYKLELEGGTTTLQQNYVGQTPIKVASGAEITGGVTVSGLNLANGAIVKQTVTATEHAAVVDETTQEVTIPAYTSYSCPTLMVNGDVNVAGVKFAVDGVDLSQVTSGDNATLTLLSATGTVTGKPVAAEQIVTQGSYGWKPVVVDKSVVMQFGKLAAGFMLMAF